jgi:hypothetical protein
VAKRSRHERLDAHAADGARFLTIFPITTTLPNFSLVILTVLGAVSSFNNWSIHEADRARVYVQGSKRRAG